MPDARRLRVCPVYGGHCTCPSTWCPQGEREIARNGWDPLRRELAQRRLADMRQWGEADV